jgi:hypothetical protein
MLFENDILSPYRYLLPLINYKLARQFLPDQFWRVVINDVLGGLAVVSILRYRVTLCFTYPPFAGYTLIKFV